MCCESHGFSACPKSADTSTRSVTKKRRRLACKELRKARFHRQRCSTPTEKLKCENCEAHPHSHKRGLRRGDQFGNYCPQKRVERKVSQPTHHENDRTQCNCRLTVSGTIRSDWPEAPNRKKHRSGAKRNTAHSTTAKWPCGTVSLGFRQLLHCAASAEGRGDRAKKRGAPSEAPALLAERVAQSAALPGALCHRRRLQGAAATAEGRAGRWGVALET